MNNEEAKTLEVLCKKVSIYWRYSEDAPEQGMPRVRSVVWYLDPDESSEAWPELAFSLDGKTRRAIDIDPADLVTLKFEPMDIYKITP